MNVRYTEQAFRDREDILDYLAARSPAGARSVLRRFDNAAKLLSEQPLAGLPTNFGDVRVLFVGRYPYKFFYLIRQDAIEILRIRHTARLPLDSI